MTALNTAARKERPAVDAIASLSKDDATLFDQMAAADKEPAGTPEPVAAQEPAPAPEPAEPSATTTEPAAASSAPAAQTAKSEPATPAKPPEGYVPVQALQEARSELKDAKAELKRYSDAIMAQLAARQQQAQPGTEQARPEAPKFVEIPDEKTDPIGALAALKSNLSVAVDQLRQNAQQTQQQVQTDQTRARMTQIWDKARVDEMQFKTATPDYDSAMQFLIESRRAELSEVYPEGPQQAQMIEAQIAQERFNLAALATNGGKTAPQMAYGLALKRGFKPKAAEPAPAPAPAIAPTQQIAALSSAQANNLSLGQTNAAAPARAPLAERMASMSPEEFGAALAKMSDADMRNLMGR